MATPTLSLIVPVFNAQKDLLPFLQSLSEQTFRPDEIIFVDDGSTDASPRILSEYVAENAGVRVIQQENCGAGAARNTGIRAASGRYLAFADADDLLAPNIYARLVGAAQADQLDVVVCNAWNYYGDARPKSLVMEDRNFQEVVTGEAWLRHRLLSGNFPHYSPLYMCRRDLIERLDISFPEGITHEDVRWVVQLLLGARRLRYDSSPLYTYRRRNHSIADIPLRGLEAVTESAIFNTLALCELANSEEIGGATAHLMKLDFVNGGCSAVHAMRRIPNRQVRRGLLTSMRRHRFFQILWDNADTMKIKARVMRAWLRSLLCGV